MSKAVVLVIGCFDYSMLKTSHNDAQMFVKWIVIKVHCKEKFRKMKQIFPEKEYRGLSPNFHIHVSVSELYIPTMGLPLLLEEICGPILGIYK
jgi:hypothetical protein